ncbi:MAG: hypothetical protein AB1609_12755 [Bacillota bacterium]
MSRTMAKVMLALALVTAVLVVAEPDAGAASDDTTYTHAAAILQIGAGARPLGMGGAFVGVADDESALFYNPAGLAFLRRSGLTSLYSTQYEVVSYGALGLATRGFGLGALYLSSPGIPGVREGSEILSEFSYTNLAGLAGTALRLGPLAIGVRGKYLAITSATLENGTLTTVNGTGFNADASALLKLGPVRLGVLYENLVQQPIRYTTGTDEPWERRLTAGASLKLGPILLAAEVESLGTDSSGGSRFYHAGAELNLAPMVLRGGATGPLSKSGPSEQERDLTAGVGLRLGGLQVDYAYLMPASLPDTHRLSLTVRF